MTNLVMLIFITYLSIQGHAKIYRKVHRDGTVEYYNIKTYKNKNFKKRKFTTRFDLLINKYTDRYQIDPYLIKCMIKVESNFKPDAVSVAGAMGLMQLMQATAAYYNVQDPLDPKENLNAGIKHMKSLMDYFKNDVELALAAYHAGLGRVKRRMKIPPIKSTIHYVNKIMKLYTGNKSTGKKVNRLYKKIARDGTIIIYSK